MTESKRKKKQRFRFKLDPITLAGILLAVILVVFITVLSVQAINDARAHITNWDDLTEKEDELYFVYYYEKDDRIADAIFPYVRDFREENENGYNLYYINANRIRGDFNHDEFDFDTSPQLFIVRNQEIESIVMGPHGIISIFTLADENQLAVYKANHVVHWGDLAVISDNLFFVYQYKEDADDHATISQDVKDFHQDNPLNIPVYFMEAESSYGAPQDTEIDEALRELLGQWADILAPFLQYDPPVVLYVLHNNEVVETHTGMTKINEILTAVQNGTYDYQQYFKP